MKYLATALVMVAVLAASGLSFAAETTPPIDITMSAQVEPDLELGHNVRLVATTPNDTTCGANDDPWATGTASVSSMNFGRLRRNVEHGWYGPLVYFVVSLYPRTSGRKYYITQSADPFISTTGGSTIDFTKSVIMTPMFVAADCFVWGTNPSGTAQGDMPEGAVIGGRDKDAAAAAANVAGVWLGEWGVASGYDTSSIGKVYESDDNGKAVIVRAVYGIYTADPACKTKHGDKCPVGMLDDEEGLILEKDLGGLSDNEQIEGKVSFTLTVP